MSEPDTRIPLATRLLAMLGTSLAGFAAYGVVSTLGSFVVFRETWLGLGLGRALLNQLSSPWFLSQAAHFVLLPTVIFGAGHLIRRRWLRHVLLFLVGAFIALAVQLAVAGVPGAAALITLLSMYLAMAGAVLPRKTALALLLPVAYGLFVANGLLPARGLIGGGLWALGLEAPLDTLAHVLLIEAPRLVVLAWLVLTWKRRFSRS